MSSQSDNIGLNDLSPVDPKHLSVEDKMWLACQQNDNGTSGWFLGKKYGLNRKVVNNYARRVRKGCKLMQREGRPSLLDGDSLSKIVQTCRLNGVANNFAIRKLIREEYHSAITQDNLGESVKRKPMSHRSVVRYVSKVLEMLETGQHAA